MTWYQYFDVGSIGGRTFRISIGLSVLGSSEIRRGRRHLFSLSFDVHIDQD